MAKILFSRFPKEIKGEIIHLFGKRILPTLFTILCDTMEAVKHLFIKASDSFDSIPDVERGTLRDTRSRHRSNATRKDCSFCMHFGVPLICSLFCVWFGRNSKKVSANWLLDTGSRLDLSVQCSVKACRKLRDNDKHF